MTVAKEARVSCVYLNRWVSGCYSTDLVVLCSSTVDSGRTVIWVVVKETGSKVLGSS